jgi:hypothetical protein
MVVAATAQFSQIKCPKLILGVVGVGTGAGIGAAIPSHPTIYRAELAKSNTPQ